MEDLQAWVAALPPEWLARCGAPAISAARSAHETAGRHYHTWEHVHECVEKLRTFPCPDPAIAFAALVFHDAVYVPGRGDNEARSADLAASHLSAILDPAGVAEVQGIILATKLHRAPDGGAVLQAVLDIDMSILGAPRERYQRYAADVKREFCPAVATEGRFRIGRLVFLRSLVRTAQIFSTAEGAARWDAPARANIAWEIAHLESQQGLLARVTTAAAEVFRKPS